MDNSREIKAVIFDMDGLLLDTERLYFEGFIRAGKSLNLPDIANIFPNLIGLNLTNGIRKLRDEIGHLVDVDEFDAQWSRENQELFTQPPPVKPGALELLDRLKTLGLPYAVATSTASEKAKLQLSRTPLGDKISVLVGGDQIARGKPAPDIFLAASKLLNTHPHHCAAFEDSENGVRAALSANMTTVQIPDIKEPDDDFRKLGHFVAKDLLAGARLLRIC